MGNNPGLDQSILRFAPREEEDGRGRVNATTSKGRKISGATPLAAVGYTGHDLSEHAYFRCAALIRSSTPWSMSSRSTREYCFPFLNTASISCV